MAYLCPVCADPQADAGHLANHLAFTAVIRGGDHEEWLDAHVPEWGGDDEATLADRLLDCDAIEAVDHPIDESAEAADGHHDHGPSPSADGRSSRGGDALDDEARDVLAEARELTRQMQASDEQTSNDERASEGETE